MKKRCFLSAAAAVVLSLCLSACSGGGESSLDNIISGLATSYLNQPPVETTEATEEITTTVPPPAALFLSLSGEVSSLSDSGVTLETPSGAVSFTISPETVVYGAEQLNPGDYVTITYSGTAPLPYAAEIITFIPAPASEITETLPEETSAEATSETASETTTAETSTDSITAAADVTSENETTTDLPVTD